MIKYKKFFTGKVNILLEYFYHNLKMYVYQFLNSHSSHVLFQASPPRHGKLRFPDVQL